MKPRYGLYGLKEPRGPHVKKLGVWRENALPSLHSTSQLLKGQLSLPQSDSPAMGGGVGSSQFCTVKKQTHCGLVAGIIRILYQRV